MTDKLQLLANNIVEFGLNNATAPVSLITENVRGMLQNYMFHNPIKTEQFTQKPIPANISRRVVDVVHGYEELADVLVAALEQAQTGKGAERHANDLPFTEQPMQTISGLVGSGDGLAYQAIKKIQESGRMKDRGARDRERLGAIVYTAGLILFDKE